MADMKELGLDTVEFHRKSTLYHSEHRWIRCFSADCAPRLSGEPREAGGNRPFLLCGSLEQVGEVAEAGDEAGTVSCLRVPAWLLGCGVRGMGRADLWLSGNAGGCANITAFKNKRRTWHELSGSFWIHRNLF